MQLLQIELSNLNVLEQTLKMVLHSGRLKTAADKVTIEKSIKF